MRSKSGQNGPSPFSSDYVEPAPLAPRQRPTLPGWIPSANVLIVLLLVFVSLITAVAGGGALSPGRALGDVGTPESGNGGVVGANLTPAPTIPPTVQPTEEPTPRPTAAPVGPTPTSLPGIAVTSVATQPVQSANVDPRSLLPKYRILSYYGHPNSTTMGILGEYSKEELLAKMQEEQAAYEAADPSRPVLLAFEVIASVAQQYPADNDTWLLHTDDETIKSYIDFATANNALVILDLQIGHSTVKAEIDSVEKWLLYPNVHLALDPEFAMPEGEVPGSSIGGIDASDVTYAQERLAQLAADNNLPPKMLIVHQFHEGMITNSQTLAPVDGVQLVIDFDGFGDPANKLSGYALFLQDRQIQFAGIKLFYKQDDPLLTPQEVVALSPPPDFVCFQ
jgi:hypothetical protein